MRKILCTVIILAALALIGAAFAESYEVPEPWTLSTAYTQDEDATAVDLTPVINAGISLLGEILVAVIAVIVLPPLRNWMEAHASKAQQDKTIALIRQLVLAAEQIFVGKGLGAKKLEYVCDGLENRGYKVDVQLIEAAVHSMNMGVLQVFDGELGTVEEPPDEKGEALQDCSGM